MATALIGLGSNVGDRRQTLDRALELLARHPALRIAARSRWYETVPVGGPPGQGPFLNGAALLETSLEPGPLAALLLETEAQLGRERRRRWGQRTLDLDLLLYDRLVIQSPALTVPHPRMAWRRFVLEPAAEIAPSMVHPIVGWTIARLLDHLNAAAAYVAITGPAGIGKSKLAERLVDHRNRRRPQSARRIADPAVSGSGEGSGVDWPSHALQAELEFLAKRARLLSADLPQWRLPGKLAVSDFWFDQSLAYAEESLAADDFAAVKRVWGELSPSVVPPKLLVVWNAQNDRLGRTIADLACHPGRGPVLCLISPALDPAAEEVLAAVDAME